MKDIQFERTIGHSVQGSIKIGSQKIDYLLYPIIPFERRSQMIRSIIQTIVFDDTYHADRQELMINYYLIRYYTDISFADTESDESTGKVLDSDTINSIYEVYLTTDIMEDLRSVVHGFDTLMSEIYAGIEFAKQELYHSHGLNRVGDALGRTIQSIGDALTPDDLQSALQSFSDLAKGLQESESDRFN